MAQFWVRRIAGQSDELREAAQVRLLEAPASWKRHGYSREIILQQMFQAAAVVESDMSRLPPDRSVGGFHTIQCISTEQIAVISAGTSSTI